MLWCPDIEGHSDSLSAMAVCCNARGLCAVNAGAVIHPLDLLTFDSADHAIMVHAFGKMLIAADAETAAALATKHSLASVTLDGEISRPGSLQGGWHGGQLHTQTASAMLDVSRVQVCSAHLIRDSWQCVY